MKKLWNQDEEIDFFVKYLKTASPTQLFYVTKDNKFYAYWPRNYEGVKTTLQSRNAFIGAYTQKWVTELLTDIAKQAEGYAVPSVICEEIELIRQSDADVAICKTNEQVQKPENIMLIIEVKMSVVWNWELIQKGSDNKLICLGDYKTQSGNPSLLRSDSMLKAIGKSINIRVSSYKASKIPIIVVGNTPVTHSYFKKVDNLKRNGIIQGFWSVNPKPLDGDGENIKNTPFNGFYRIDSYEELTKKILELLKEEREFFGSMQLKTKLGEIIEVANLEATYEKKAEKFLKLIRNENE